MGSVLRVLAIYPAFDPQINEMAMVWQHICACYPVKLVVFTTVRDRLKGQDAAKDYEQHPGMEIYRFLNPSTWSDQLEFLSLKHRPDLIFCAVTHNMPLAVKIGKITGAKILLHNEFLFDDRMLLNRRYYLGLAPLRGLAGAAYRRWLFSHTARILFSNPREISRAAYSPRAAYLPWPHRDAIEPLPYSKRDQHHAVYIGSLSRAKGVERLFNFYHALLKQNGDIRLSIIGPAADDTGTRVLEQFRGELSGRVEIQKSCSGQQAVDAIRKAFFIFSPGERLGWGLIGDAWRLGTPLIAYREHYDLAPGQNCLSAGTPEQFVEAVQKLIDDRGIWQTIQDGGYQTAASHRVESAAGILYQNLADLTRA